MKEGPSHTGSVDHLVHIAAWVILEEQPWAVVHMATVEHMLEAASGAVRRSFLKN